MDEQLKALQLTVSQLAGDLAAVCTQRNLLQLKLEAAQAAIKGYEEAAGLAKPYSSPALTTSSPDLT